MAFQGTILTIDFYFPNNKTRIISVYLPTNNPDLLARTQNQITLWSTESKIRNWHTIILGDFNSNNTSARKKNTIFSEFTSNNYTSLLNFHNILTPTWRRNNSYSQIDDIWVSSDLLLNIDSPELINATGITDSDYTILLTTWHTNFSPSVPRNKKKKRKIYLYDRMTEENWENFTNDTHKSLTNTTLS